MSSVLATSMSSSKSSKSTKQKSSVLAPKRISTSTSSSMSKPPAVESRKKKKAFQPSKKTSIHLKRLEPEKFLLFHPPCLHQYWKSPLGIYRTQTLFRKAPGPCHLHGLRLRYLYRANHQAQAMFSLIFQPGLCPFEPHVHRVGNGGTSFQLGGISAPISAKETPSQTASHLSGSTTLLTLRGDCPSLCVSASSSSGV